MWYCLKEQLQSAPNKYVRRSNEEELVHVLFPAPQLVPLDTATCLHVSLIHLCNIALMLLLMVHDDWLCPIVTTAVKKSTELYEGALSMTIMIRCADRDIEEEPPPPPFSSCSVLAFFFKFIQWRFVLLLLLLLHDNDRRMTMMMAVHSAGWGLCLSPLGSTQSVVSLLWNAADRECGDDRLSLKGNL